MAITTVTAGGGTPARIVRPDPMSGTLSIPSTDAPMSVIVDRSHCRTLDQLRDAFDEIEAFLSDPAKTPQLT